MAVESLRILKIMGGKKSIGAVGVNEADVRYVEEFACYLDSLARG